MTTDVDQPFALDLADPAAVRLELTGGKGSSLARLAAAGLPVPGGFHVTTDAYRAAVAGAPQRSIVDAAGTVDPDRPETHEAAAARITQVFATLEIPAAVADAVRAGYSMLCTTGDAADAPVAVRSSATAEDLPRTAELPPGTPSEHRLAAGHAEHRPGDVRRRHG
jgi:pyruvate,water dikinase